jgi:hypothetical protein
MNAQTSAKHKHAVFLGSSKESEWLAKQIEGALFRGYSDFLEVSAWYHFGSWPTGQATLETLEHRLNETDFAVLVLSEDDWTQSRDDQSRPAPRDNVVFELGLFMDRLGRDRAFFGSPTQGISSCRLICSALRLCPMRSPIAKSSKCREPAVHPDGRPDTAGRKPRTESGNATATEAGIERKVPARQRPGADDCLFRGAAWRHPRTAGRGGLPQLRHRDHATGCGERFRHR